MQLTIPEIFISAAKNDTMARSFATFNILLKIIFFYNEPNIKKL